MEGTVIDQFFTIVVKLKGLKREGSAAGSAVKPRNHPVELGGVGLEFVPPVLLYWFLVVLALRVGAKGRYEVLFVSSK